MTDGEREAVVSDVTFEYRCVGAAVGTFFATLTARGVPVDEARFFASDVLSALLERLGPSKSISVERADFSTAIERTLREANTRTERA